MRSRRTCATTIHFVGIESYRLGTHHTWTDDEIAAYEAVWPIGTRERLAFDLLLYTGQRVGDVAAMRRSDLRNGAIHLKPEKTGDDLVIPLHPNLLRSMKACPSKGLTLFGQINGRPISGAGLSSVVERAARAAGLPACASRTDCGRLGCGALRNAARPPRK